MTPQQHTIVQISEKRDKKVTTKLHAAAGNVTLCDIRKHYSRVVKWIQLEHQVGVKTLEDPLIDPQIATVPILAPQPWPKHWPSTRVDYDVTKSSEPVDPCHACKKAAEQIWRAPKPTTDAELSIASTRLKELANTVNPVIVEAHAERDSLGFPTNNQQGAGGTADQTAQFVARAHDLDNFISETGLLKARIISDVAHLEQLINRRQGKAPKPEPLLCGQSQIVMNESDVAGWDGFDKHCGGRAEGELGMCDKHRVSYSRHLRKKEAA